MEDMVNRWQGRRVFLTGHTGFKGGWLALWLAARGAIVRGFALAPSSEPNFFTSASVGSVLDDLRGDIRDYPQVEPAMTEFAPEVVFHLAAQPLVRHSYLDPLGTYSTNIMGTAHVLEAVRKVSSVRAVVCVTTDKCYENREWVWPYRETDSLGGYDPYSSSKACAELVSAAYRSSFFPVEKLAEHKVGLATARAGNVIGGGDWSEDRLIPDLVRGFKAKQDVLIRCPNASRPWQHVLEPLHGYMMLAEQLLEQNSRAMGAFNFGPDARDVWPVDRIATSIARMWGEEARWVCGAAPTLHEAGALSLDASKARAELGWRPGLGIELALDWTVTWYRASLNGEDMGDKTREQIKAYEEIVH